MRDNYGAALSEADTPTASWLAVLASSDHALFLQLDGAPSSLSELITPDHRLRIYGGVGQAYAACHLGGDHASDRLAHRPDISTHAVYCKGEITREASEEAVDAAPGQEVVRRVTILRPASGKARAAARGSGVGPAADAAAAMGVAAGGAAEEEGGELHLSLSMLCV